MNMQIQWTYLDRQAMQMLPLPHTFKTERKKMFLTSRHNSFLVLKIKEEIIANTQKM